MTTGRDQIDTRHNIFFSVFFIKIIQNAMECLKQRITTDKVYGSDVTDDFIVKRYLYSPYP